MSQHPDDLPDIDVDELYGQTCPACGGPIEQGSVRYTGSTWQHKNPDSHPQAGHHRFDAEKAVDDRDDPLRPDSGQGDADA